MVPVGMEVRTYGESLGSSCAVLPSTPSVNDGLQCWKPQQICSGEKRKSSEKTGDEQMQEGNLHISAVCSDFWDLVMS